MNVAFETPELNTATVDTGDRLSFTVFMAIVVHALLIFGLGFKLPIQHTGSQTMEITLATHQSLKAPDHADFLAQHNQEASGTTTEARQLTTEHQADFADTQINDVNPLHQVSAASPNTIKDQHIISTQGQNSFKTQLKKNPDVREEQELQEGLLEDHAAITAEIASLQAKLDKQRQEYAKRPRIRTLTSVSTKESFDAKYLNEWGEKIENFGNRNYPQEALKKQITGRLRMSVIINPDGTIYSIEILQSSGKRIFDDAARQIVRLAAPFSKFPPEIRLQADRLQIIRTWKFEMTGISTSSN